MDTEAGLNIAPCAGRGGESALLEGCVAGTLMDSRRNRTIPLSHGDEAAALISQKRITPKQDKPKRITFKP